MDTKRMLAVVVAVAMLSAAPAQAWEAPNQALMDSLREAREAPPQEEGEDFETQLRIALEQFEHFNAAESDDPQMLRWYATLLRWSGDTDLAVETLDRAARIDPADAETWLDLGQARALWGPTHVPATFDALRKAIEASPKQSPERTRAHAALGGLALQERLYELAGEHLERAAAADPPPPEAVIGLAAVEVAQGRVLAAEERIETLGEIPADAQFYLQSVLHRALDAFDEARFWFPDDAAHHGAYGTLLLRADRFTDAKGPFQRAAELEPANPVWRNFLGSVYRRLGRNEDAIAAYQKSIEINPEQPRVREYLADLVKAKSQSPES